MFFHEVFADFVLPQKLLPDQNWKIYEIILYVFFSYSILCIGFSILDMLLKLRQRGSHYTLYIHSPGLELGMHAGPLFKHVYR